MRQGLRQRRHARCHSDIAITFSLFNKTKPNDGIARNISRSGIYFETTRKLSPGMLVVIRNKGTWISDHDSLKDGVILPQNAASKSCRDLKNLVVGEVKRCLTIEEGIKPRYGVAVCYLSPAV